MKTDWKKFFKRLYQKALVEEDILSSSAQVAFYFTFALFPLLLFLISLFGIILESADEFRTELFIYLRQIMPYSAYDLVQSTIKEVTESSSGGKLTIGLLVALWSASAGVDSLRTALNSVYNFDEKRSWLKTKALSLTLTLTLTLLVTLALGFVFYGWKLLSLGLGYFNLEISQVFLMILQWVTILIVLLIIFGIIYNFLPSQKPFKWHWITPGAIAGIMSWIALSYVFKVYLSYFNSYDKTYGSLGAVIILMLWLFLTALVILIGGIINATLQELTDPEAAKQAEARSEAKLERAKADMPADQIEEMKQEKSAASKQEESEPAEKNDKENKLPALSGQNAAVAPISTAKASFESQPLETPSANQTLENTSNKTIVGLTVAGVFGFLMGLIFKKKD